MKFLLPVFAFIYITASAQTTKPDLPIDESTKLITYTKVIDVKGASKDSLYNKALKWCNEFYKNPVDVIREKEMEAGKILCKARYKVMNPPDKNGLSTEGGVVEYTLILQFREGRYKYVMTEFNWKQTSYYPIERWLDFNSASYKTEFSVYLNQVSDKSKEILSALENNMFSKGVVKKDDW